MFTGIIEHVGSVSAILPFTGGLRIAIDVGPLANGAKLGGSVAVNGVCLTITNIDGNRLSFDAVTETIARTNLARVKPGEKVNLERALPAHGRLDGHIVQGHVDGNVVVVGRKNAPNECLFHLSTGPELLPCIVPKGSVALDGVSLTVADVRSDEFSVAIIPTTLEETTIRDWKTGHQVNLETDIIVRTIIHQLGRVESGGGITMDRLREGGFL